MTSVPFKVAINLQACTLTIASPAHLTIRKETA